MTRTTVHQLKITLRNVKPPVWRRIVVRSDTTLAELAAVLEAAMGWLGSHLHVFEVGRTRYGMLDPDWDTDDLDESKFRLGGVLSDVGSKMRWDYDFGDGWEHEVLVEAIDPPEPEVDYPICVTGRRACPPEDCGGPWGYEELVNVLADPNQPDPNEIREWISEFDPTEFDVGETTAAMRSPRPLGRWS